MEKIKRETIESVIELFEGDSVAASRFLSKHRGMWKMKSGYEMIDEGKHEEVLKLIGQLENGVFI